MSKTVVVVVALLVAGAGCAKQDSAATRARSNEPSAAANQPVEGVKGRRVNIEVTKQGYRPASVDLKANEEVTLVFTRTENTECGAVVKIPSLNVEKPLPLDEPVPIAFKADKPGEVAFTCGMDMMQGKLVVSQN